VTTKTTSGTTAPGRSTFTGRPAVSAPSRGGLVADPEELGGDDDADDADDDGDDDDDDDDAGYDDLSLPR